VPAAAIQRASFGTFVYAIKPDDTATVRKVTLGVSEGDRVAVTEGVAPGERIVLEGVDGLQEGVPVEIVGTGHLPQSSPEGAAPAGRGQGQAPGPAGTPGAAPAPAGTRGAVQGGRGR
jgi:multidrug efflux system membrane fusion protein